MTDDIYQEQIIDHYKNPRNFGGIESPDVRVRESNASCGDLVEVSIKFDEKKRVGEIGFKGVGCAISVAAASMLTEKIRSQKSEVGEIEGWSENDMEEMLGIDVSETRKKCSTLALKAVKKALSQDH